MWPNLLFLSFIKTDASTFGAGRIKPNVCCWQIGVGTAMTLAGFIMRVSLLLSVGKQACG